MAAALRIYINAERLEKIVSRHIDSAGKRFIKYNRLLFSTEIPFSVFYSDFTILFCFVKVQKQFFIKKIFEYIDFY